MCWYSKKCAWYILWWQHLEISVECAKHWLQFLPLWIRAAFSLLRQRKLSGEECPRGDAGEQNTFSPGWAAPWQHHRAAHHKSSEGLQHDHLFHPSMTSCHLKLLFLWKRRKIDEEVGRGFFLMPKETAAALSKHWHSDRVVKPHAKEDGTGYSLYLMQHYWSNFHWDGWAWLGRTGELGLWEPVPWGPLSLCFFFPHNSGKTPPHH